MKKRRCKQDASQSRGDDTEVTGVSEPIAKKPKAAKAAASPLTIADGLPWLLGEGTSKGLSVTEFRKSYFERKPCHLKRTPEIYRALSELGDIEYMLKLMDCGTTKS